MDWFGCLIVLGTATALVGLRYVLFKMMGVDPWQF